MSVVQDLFSCDSFVRGHHVYKDDWTPTLGEILECKREPQNEKDPNAVAVTKDGKVVGHVPLIYTRSLKYQPSPPPYPQGARVRETSEFRVL